MSGRNSEPKKPKSGRVGFLGRTKAMSSGGSSGWEATTIGFTLVGCIAAGAGAGYFLDQRFGTSFWLPILFLVGVFAGFREMFVVLGRINKEQEKRRRDKAETVNLAPTPTQIGATTEAPQERKRVFQVPPPPLPGQKSAEKAPGEPETTEELIERLLEEDKPDESK